MKKVMFTAFAVGLGITASVMAQVPSYVPTNGLVGWWPFNGNANDESGNGNNGMVNGATLTSDRFGNANKAYSFNSNTINVNNNSVFNLLGGFTINAWVNSNAASGENTIVSKYQDNDDAYSFKIYNLSPTIQIASSPANWTICQDDNSLNTGEWINLVSTFDTLTNELNIYKNGTLIHQCTSNSTLAISGADLVFGGFVDSPQLGSYFFGDIDDIGIWNRALTQQEISDLYNANNCSNDLIISPTTNNQNIGGNVIFTATSSESNPTYTWQSDFGQGFQTLNNYGNYSGATTSSLTISNVQLTNHNQPIRAISASGNCIDTSNIATIQIADTCITNVTVYDTLLTTVTDTLIINTTLSLPAPNNENTILIYPNPASDHITIDNGNFSAMAGYSIKITNNAGQQVFQSAIDQAQFYVDLSTWTGNGLYFVHVIDPQNNTVTVRKIVLQ